MPMLARENRKLSAVTGSAGLRADAAESAVCALPFSVGLARSWAHCLAYLMGRSRCGSGHRASHRPGRPRGDAWEGLRLSLKNVTIRCIHRNEDEGMNPTFAKAIAALVPTLMLLVGSTLQLSRRKGTAAVFQLIGAVCFMMVVIAHLCEALGWFPWMHWGLTSGTILIS